MLMVGITAISGGERASAPSCAPPACWCLRQPALCGEHKHRGPHASWRAQTRWRRPRPRRWSRGSTWLRQRRWLVGALRPAPWFELWHTADLSALTAARRRWHPDLCRRQRSEGAPGRQAGRGGPGAVRQCGPICNPLSAVRLSKKKDAQRAHACTRLLPAQGAPGDCNADRQHVRVVSITWRLHALLWRGRLPAQRRRPAQRLLAL